jgi:MORN repeat
LLGLTTGKTRNGKGKYGYTTKGFTYEGGWSNNKKTGIGKMDFGTKGKYFGRNQRAY